MTKVLQLAALTLPTLIAIPVAVAQPQSLQSLDQFLTAQQPASRILIYQCTNDRMFEARYQPQSVDLMLAGSPTLTLPQVRSGSGARYSNGETTLFTKGSAAFVEMNGAIIYEDCLAEGVAETNQSPLLPQRPAAPEPVPGMW